LLDLNATRAAIRAGYSAKTATETGHENLRKPHVAKAVQAAQAERSERIGITQDMVLERYWALATADPNELTQVRRECCRHCYGKYHNYQWRNPAELSAAVELSQKSTAKDGEALPPLPDDSGGYGFDPKLRPCSKCRRCDGEGVISVYVADTRDLSPSAKLLFAGVKQTLHGIEIKMNDQLAALNSVARHLGMFAKDKGATSRAEDLTDQELEVQVVALLAKSAGGGDLDVQGAC
jgi:phage terminase small subunit